MSLKQLVNTPSIYEAFTEELVNKISLLHMRLEVAVDITDIHKLQGEIRALRKLLSLREEVNKKG